MKAAVFKGVGLPLAIEEIADPTPGPDDVVLKIGRCGICSSDLGMTDGHSPIFQFAPGTVMGHEFAGEVVACGSDVERLRVGDRVTALCMSGCGNCATCLAGRPVFCAQIASGPGGYAEYLMTKERVAVKLPSTLSLADGALVEPMAVSLHGVSLAQLPPGARVLVIGAGPIGLAAIFWARRLGAGPIAVTASSHRREPLARLMGADHFVVPEEGQTLANACADVLGGQPDVVFECVGARDLLSVSIDCVRPTGTVVVLGFCSVPDAFVPASAVYKEIRMQFSMVYSIGEFEHVARVMDSGAVEARAMITDKVSLAGLPDMFESLRHRNHQCKVMVDPWSD